MVFRQEPTFNGLAVRANCPYCAVRVFALFKGSIPYGYFQKRVLTEEELHLEQVAGVEVKSYEPHTCLGSKGIQVLEKGDF